MTRNVTTRFRRSTEASLADEVNLVFLTISHPTIVDPIRVVWDTVDWMYNGNLFLGFPFEITILSDDENPPTANLSIQNVDPRIGDSIRQLTSPPRIKIELLSSEDFEYNLLLHGDGVDASTTITDSSSHGHTFTVHGAVAIDTAQSKFGGASIEFGNAATDYLSGDGSEQSFAFGYDDFTLDFWHRPKSLTANFSLFYLPQADNNSAPQIYTYNVGFFQDHLAVSGTITDFQFGTGDFTIDCWVRFTGGMGIHNSIFDTRGAGGNLVFSKDNNDKISNEGSGLVSTTVVVQNTWYHIAWTRASGTSRLFINGIVEATGADSNNYGSDPTSIGVGWFAGGSSSYFTGYMEELRVIKGAAIWTANFGVPVSAYERQHLLLHFDGTDGTAISTDYSDSGHTVVSSNGAQHDNAQSVFGGTSGLFDGTNDYITVTGTISDFQFGTGDFTVDYWVRFAAVPGFQVMFDTRPAGVPFILSLTPASKITNEGAITGATTIAANTWYHVAFTRQSGFSRLFINGVLDASATDTTNYDCTSTGLTLGRFQVGNSAFLNGWMDEVRIIKGRAFWTANFTPPTVAYNPQQNPKLLLHFDGDGTDGSTVFVDSSDSAHTVTATGVTTRTAQSKFGGSSGLFRGSQIGKVIFWDGIDENFSINSLTVNTWTHIALTRAAGISRLFMDGVLQIETSENKYNSQTEANFPRIGPNAAGLAINGHIDEMRIINGVAAWTVNFTPEVAAYAGGSLDVIYSADKLFLINVSVDIMNITGQIVGWDYLQRVWPGPRAMKATFPGLYR